MNAVITSAAIFQKLKDSGKLRKALKQAIKKLEPDKLEKLKQFVIESKPL